MKINKSFIAIVALSLSIGANAAKFDFNNDGKSDIVWRKSSTNALWKMKADGSHSYKNIGTKSSAYAMIGSGDFNGDGIADILWKKGSKNVIWYMKTSGSHTYKNIGTKSTSYSVKGIGDFNGDGIADILWNKGSNNYIWYMKADGSHTYKKIGTKAYNIRGIADFNGDGKDDILWRKGTTNYIWYMKADGSHTYKKISSKSIDYQVVGVGDFNGDGNADILWRKDNNNHIWYMHSSGSHSYKNIGTKTASYEVAAIGDYNGDGKDDIFWRNKDINAIWLMKSNGAHTYKDAGTKYVKYELTSSNLNMPITFKFPSDFYKVRVKKDYHHDGTVDIRPQGGKFSLNSDKSLSITDYIFENGHFVVDTDSSNDNSDYLLADGDWVQDTDDSNIPFTSLTQNGSSLVVQDIHKLSLKAIDKVDGVHVKVADDANSFTLPSGSKTIVLVHTLMANEYRVWEVETKYGEDGAESNYASINELMQNQCGYQFTDGQYNGEDIGIAFDCDDVNQSTGALIGIKNSHDDGDGDSEDNIISNVGSWEKVTLPNSNIDAVVITIKDKYKRHHDNPLFAMKDGVVWRGEFRKMGIKESMRLVNKTAFDAFEDAIADYMNTH